MALVSPPKPWQRSQPESLQPSPSPTVAPTAADQQPPQAPPSSSGLYQPNSFGYRQSTMGYTGSPSTSMYMPSSYAGSGYGSPYNGMYGNGASYGSGSYGSPYSSPAYNQWGMRPYNSMPFAGQMDAYKGTPVNFLVDSGHAFMSGMQQHVSTFGRFSQILHMNLDALQMSFSSILQLLTNASMLRHELSAFFGTFGSIRAIYLLYVKLRQMILRLVGRDTEACKLEFEGLWQDSSQGRWGWMPTFLTLSLAVMIVRRLVQFITSGRTDTTARSNQQEAMPSSYIWPSSSSATFDSGHPWHSSASSSSSGRVEFTQMHQAPIPLDPTSYDQAFSGTFAMPDF